MIEKAWQCPTLKRLARENPKAASRQPHIHYVPTLFDDNATTPFRWQELPWAIEVGDMHGSGNLMLFQDGAVKTYKDVYESILRSGSFTRKPVP